MRMCRGRLRVAMVDETDVGSARPRCSSSAGSIGGDSGTDQLGTFGVDGPAAKAALDSELDMPFEVVGDKREWL